MTKKSAAQVKVVHPKSELEKSTALLEEFDIAKFGYIETLKVNIRIANRVDNLLNIRDYVKNFWGEEANRHNDIIYLKDLRDAGIACYERILKVAEKWTLEDFMKPELDNYLEDIADYDNSNDLDTMEELAVAGIEFLSVKPWGEKMMGMHHMIQEKMMELGIEYTSEPAEE